MTNAEVLERRLGRVLGVGSLMSMALFAAGLVALFLGNRQWSDVLVHAGLMILLGTPFARVAITIVNYWRERDWLFVAMTSTVLLVLIAGVIVATL